MIQAEKSNYLSNQDLEEIKSQESLVSIAKSKGINTEKLQFELSYEQQLEALQIELVKLQHWIQEQKMRVVIIFEGRDAADLQSILTIVL